MKKILKALPVLGIAALALASCGGSGNENAVGNSNSKNKFTVWAADKANDLTKQQLTNFLNENKDIDAYFTVEKVSEAEAATNMIQDVQGGADLFCFAQDQFARLVQAGALQKIGGQYATDIKANNDKGSVAAATSGEELYAFPLTSDNGYFMYYDKSVISEDHIDSLEQICNDCVTAKKYFSMEVETSAWYIASWFFATGCSSSWETDNTGKFTALNDDWNSDKGLKSVKAMKAFYDTLGTYHLSNSTASKATNAAVLISGTWDIDDAKTLFGDNLGITDLPSFTVDGETYHMGSYSGNKLLGIKPQTDTEKALILNKAAAYLTGEAAQLERFNSLGWGPSNLNAQATDAVKADAALSALAQQNNYATPQGQILGAWWDIAKVIGQNVKDSDGSDAKLKEVLAKYEDDCITALNCPDGLIWVGASQGWSNKSPEVIVGLTDDGKVIDGTYTIEVTFTEEMDYKGGRFVFNKTWNSAGDCTNVDTTASVGLLDGGGDKNIVVEEAGTYVVTATFAGGTCTKIVITKK